MRTRGVVEPTSLLAHPLCGRTQTRPIRERTNALSARGMGCRRVRVVAVRSSRFWGALERLISYASVVSVSTQFFNVHLCAEPQSSLA
jgi:hypothetical protein